MPLYNPFYDLALGDLFDTIIPDLVLSFALFTSLIYAVLGRRFGQQRPAIVMSAALGLALAIGLVWWEQYNDLSIRDLGPVAAGFALIVLAGVMFQAIRAVGGNWAGAAIAFGASIVVGWVIGIDWPVHPEAVQTVTVVALILGVLAFLLHRRGHLAHASFGRADSADIRHDMRNLHEDHHVADRLRRGFRHLRKNADLLHEHPEDAQNIMLQLRRMLPAEGWLTQRMARLREKAHRIQRGHIVQIEEIQQHFAKLPSQARKKVGRELAERYKELQMGRRIERLDKTVAAIEKRIRDLTREAQSCLQSNDQRRLSGVLEMASKLQKHNAKLIQQIERTESKLLATAKRIAEQPGEVRNA